jgi:hypothetical protein
MLSAARAYTIGAICEGTLHGQLPVLRVENDGLLKRLPAVYTFIFGLVIYLLAYVTFSVIFSFVLTYATTVAHILGRASTERFFSPLSSSICFPRHTWP